MFTVSRVLPRGGVAIFALLLMSGCTLGSDFTDLGNPGSVAPPQAEATARLDWGQGTIHLPLEAYGMSDRDRQIVYAAREIALVRCALGVSVVPVEALPAVQAWLDRPPPQRTQTLYGYWNASYLASKQEIAEKTLPDGVKMDPIVSKKCANEDPAYLGLNVIAAGYQPESQWKLLPLDVNGAYEKTIASAAFAELRSAKEQCIRDAGYTLLEDNDLGVVAISDSATEEQRLAATLVEATCSDNMNFTQQAADLNASYEQEYINTHQGELVAIKKLADERVATATQMLRDAGVM